MNAINRTSTSRRWWLPLAETCLLLLVIFAVAGSPPPAVNEAHYLAKAKNFWQPDWLANDPFVSSGKAHRTFYFSFGWLLQFFDMPTVAWIGRFVGWFMLAIGLQRLGQRLFTDELYAADRHSADQDSGRSVRSLSLIMLPVTIVWMAGITYANLAGEWVIGGIEAKVPAYGFMLLGLTQIVRGRWNYVWPLLGSAAAFHVLVGGWSVVAAMVVRVIDWRWWGSQQPSCRELLCLCMGGGLALFGLWPAWQLAAGVSPFDQIIAARIYAYGRLGHHLTPSSFPWHWYVRHGGLAILTAGAAWSLLKHAEFKEQARWRRFLLFAAGGPLIAMVGLLVGLIPAIDGGLGAKLLRFYWFRMTDALVPLAAAMVALGWLVLPIQHRQPAARWRFVAVAWIVLSLTLVARDYFAQLRYDLPAAVVTAHDVVLPDRPAMTMESRAEVFAEWQAICNYIRQETSEDAVFITPRAQHTFRWYARRAEVVNWKDVPQDVPSLLDWARRINRIFPISLRRRHTPLEYDVLASLAADYDAKYILVDLRVVTVEPPLPRLYPERLEADTTYALYRLPVASP
ncbi:DUF6798 domain-containing protein [Planctomycetaceae bacterium SH139]